MLTIIKGGYLFSPDDSGPKDLLIANGKIERIDREISIPEGVFPQVEVVKAPGKFIFPGFIDPHVHIIGGGGSGGPRSRVKEVFSRDIVMSGITTLVGTVGTDTISKLLPTLLVKVKALNLSGLNAFMYAGSVLFPPVTLTGSVEKDISYIAEIIGVKTGLGEPVYPRPDLLALENLLTESRRAAALSGKCGVVHVHLSATAAEWIGVIESILQQRGLSRQQVVFTHVNHSPALLERAFAYARRGGWIDLTSCIRPPERPQAVKPSSALKRYLDAGGPLEQVTFSSDGNASRVLADGKIDYTRIGTLIEEFRDCVQKEGIPIPQALAVVTRNAARLLGMANERGSLQEGFWADLALFTKDLELTDLMAGGRWLLRDGVMAQLDPFE